MDKETIKQAIIQRVRNAKKVAYSIWQIGLTHDPEGRKEQHRNEGRNVQYWQQWVTDSLADAEEIESFFINKKGMKGGTGGDLSQYRTVYVYIF